MTDLIKWNPYEDLQRVREELNRFFSPSFPLPGTDRVQGFWGPSVDVRETGTQFIVSAEIPGVDPENIEVTVTEDGLTLAGEVKQETDVDQQGYRRMERRYGSFRRTIPFSQAVKHEEAAADYKNGILTVTVPKADPGKGKATRLRIKGPGNLQ